MARNLVIAGLAVCLLAPAGTEGHTTEEDIKDQVKGTDFGFNLGLGANFGKLNASARYCLGLSNIADFEDGDLKNCVIQLSLGYKLFGD